jgi:hypothetical protein
MLRDADPRPRPLGHGLKAVLVTSLILAGACKKGRIEPPEAIPSAPAIVQASPALPGVPEELVPSSSKPVGPATVPMPAVSAEPWNGPWLVVTRPAATISSEADFDGDKRLGYARSGGRIPVYPKPVSNGQCKAGWYQLVETGFICGNVGTLDPKSPELRLVQRQPDLEEILPYPYARNTKHGTPLYRSVPTPEQVHRYEPYRLSAKITTNEPEYAPDAGDDAGNGDAGETADSGPDLPWWQQDASDHRLNELTLDQLRAESDDVLAMRLVQGFYVAIDRTFRWNSRTWYKTTRGLVAPADRFAQVPSPVFKGVELDGVEWKLPVAWVYGGRKSSSAYAYDEGGQALKPARTLAAFAPVLLTGQRREIASTKYYETLDGLWVKVAHVRVARLGELPGDLGEQERWIDVSLSEQTLVAYQGARPVYATLISSGKKSPDKEKDHSTPVGQWRIREKHLTTTMDGDGTLAGDLPYSIEDVPYVVYFHRSYALHGAFWHQNFGVRMSHGCVNLAPLDAKRVFSFVDPPLPTGWHGVWSGPKQVGSRVVVHE